jgi:hypothetical protein
MEVVEVQRRPQQVFDDEQEIITLSPEVKRFSGDGGKQTFAVDVKASFSPIPDHHQVQYTGEGGGVKPAVIGFLKET